MSDPSQIPRWCDTLLDNSDFLHQALGKFAKAAVGIFSVAKKNKQLRVIFDARCANVLFRDPDRTALPTASSFSRLEARAKGNLFISQGDLKNAFYMLRSFPGLSDYSVMPPFEACALDTCELHGTPIDPKLFNFTSPVCVDHGLVIVPLFLPTTFGSRCGSRWPTRDRRIERQVSRGSSCLMRNTARPVCGRFLCVWDSTQTRFSAKLTKLPRLHRPRVSPFTW